MGRPPRFTADQFLDAALARAAAEGPSAVTMTGVAAAVGAPSGSIYHRFPNRPALLGSLWLRTVERFQEGLLAAAEGTDPQAAALALADHAIAWSRANEAAARLLLHGAAELGRDEWPAPLRRAWERREKLAIEAIVDLGRRLEMTDDRGRERLLLAVVELPLALVRRRLRAGKGIPPDAEETIRPAVQALLGAAKKSA